MLVPSRNPIKIGLSLPVTGRYGNSAGIVYGTTYRFWVEQINKAGGLLGRPVELVSYDDRSDPETSGQIYERLIREDKVDLLLGPCHSAMVEGMVHVIEREQKVLLQGSGSSHEIFRKGRRYVFLCWSGADFDYPRSILEWAATLPEAKRPRRIALVYTDFRIGPASAAGVRHYALFYGGEIVHDEPILAAPFDYDALFRRVKASRPDLVMVGLDHTRPDDPRVSSVKAFRNAGIDAMLWLSDNPEPDDPKELLNGVYLRTTWLPLSPNPTSKRFLESFTKAQKTIPEYHHAGGYACCQVLQQAVEGVGSTDNGAFRDYLLAHEFDTVMGKIRFQPNGLPDCVMQLSQWVNGQLHIIYPPEAKTGEPLLD